MQWTPAVFNGYLPDLEKQVTALSNAEVPVSRQLPVPGARISIEE